jgi:hypothetical protein
VVTEYIPVLYYQFIGDVQPQLWPMQALHHATSNSKVTEATLRHALLATVQQRGCRNKHLYQACVSTVVHLLESLATAGMLEPLCRSVLQLHSTSHTTHPKDSRCPLASAAGQCDRCRQHCRLRICPMRTVCRAEIGTNHCLCCVLHSHCTIVTKLHEQIPVVVVHCDTLQ